MDNSENYTLSKIKKKKKSNRDIFQELMPVKVNEALFVGTYYDSYSIVREGRFFDRIMGEYLQFNLFSEPRITSVSTTEEALEVLEKRNIDMVVLMANLDKEKPVILSKLIRSKWSHIPILLLVNNNRELKYFDEAASASGSIDRIFIWNGDSKVFLAMIKYVEDRANLENDVKVGDVRVILLVEDSQIYYTRYLPLLYSIVLQQTQHVVSEESDDEVQKIVKMRVRPKIILATTYEEAVSIVDDYKDNIICIITDVTYPRNCKMDKNAGTDLVKYARSKMDVPVLMQSSDAENAIKAAQVDADFIDKNSENLSFLITDFINKKLGFGDFIFKNSRGLTVATAKNLNEFEQCLKEVPAESLLYHSRRNGISTWVMARGEISLAKKLRPYSIEDFDSTSKLRSTIISLFEQSRLEILKGRVIPFNKNLANSNRYVSRIGAGSLGGKGRGLAFLSNFIENIDFETIIPDLDIQIPKTCIIGADEYSRFLEYNHFQTVMSEKKNYDEIQKLFIEAHFTDEIYNSLKEYIEVITDPIAVRSSGLFEDSLLQPFTGVYRTYMLPNNNPDPEARLKDLILAIKLVYASIFSKSAREYFDIANYKIEEEKMAVILQQVVGIRVGAKFYPHVSGIAQSYNFYPYGCMKPEDGYAIMGVGLGRYIAGGEKAWRYCPRFPALELSSLQDQIRDSQSWFYAINLDFNQVNLIEDGELSSILRLELKEAEEDGSLKQCAMVYDSYNDMLVSDFKVKGQRVVNFGNILKYDSIPLSKTLDIMLQYLKEAMGFPVEIEFALDLSEDNPKPVLYMLQTKPLTKTIRNEEIIFDNIDASRIILKSSKGMGNGKIETIRDVIFVVPEKFERIKTGQMALEINEINTKFIKENKDYILIGPGRWGTRDASTGIPAYWSQISQAKVIVEMDLPGFSPEASLGSHFFHNITSLNVGYFSINQSSESDFLDLEILNKQEIVQETTFFKHVKFQKPLTILMNGKEQKAIIQWNK
jgi:DNA-binding response OmpR family regulator